MSSLLYDSHSSESRTSNPITGTEDIDVQQFRNFIRESKSLGCSPEISAVSTREVVSESFVDALTKGEIDEFRKKLFSYWEKSTKTGEKLKIEVDESKTTRHKGSDPKIQDEEAVNSFEDAKSEVASTTERHDIRELIETELKNIRDTKLAEVDVKKTQVGMLRRSEKMDFTELRKKAADLPAMSDLASVQQTRQLPILRRTDALEMVLRIYECTDSDPAGVLQDEDAKESVDVFSPEMSKRQEFRKRLVIEMKIMYGRLVSAPTEITHSIIEEAESDISSSSFQTKDSVSSSRDPSLLEYPFQSGTFYPEGTTNSAGTTPRGDSSSLSGLVNVPELNIPEDARNQSTGSGNSNSTSSTTAPSDDTLSNISSLPTDTSGTRTSVSSLQDADALASAQPRVPPPLLLVDDATDDDPFLALPPTPADAGPSYLAVPQIPGMPLSLDTSTENAKAEDIGDDRRRREPSPKEDENEKAPKRRAL